MEVSVEMKMRDVDSNFGLMGRRGPLHSGKVSLVVWKGFRRREHL